MARPDYLPEYSNPPLNEVVLGVQFSPARNYQQIRAYEVWQLFKADFPHIEEHAALPPTFETFGLPTGPLINFGVVTGANHDRYWFVSTEKTELLQFQADKMLHNWRKAGDLTNPYPRFERILPSFRNELQTLEQYFASLAPQDLDINQCEVSYINHIPLEMDGSELNHGDILRFANLDANIAEEINFSFRRAIYDRDKNPTGRLIVEAQTAVHNVTRKKIIILTLTARGAPPSSGIEAALEFIRLGRDIIVTTFTEITTDRCHEIWGRLK